MILLLLLALSGAERLALSSVEGQEALPADDGYRGIWYMNQPSRDEYRYKYSGGFATYPQQHLPIAIHSKAADKTFFVYGGTVKGKQELLHLVSYYDHATGEVPRPRILLNKKTDDAHDNPTLQIDDSGHLWIFSNAHGTTRPAYLHRSVKPYSIDAFERILDTNFSYSQPWHLPGQGFLFLHTRYKGGRGLHWMTSADGRSWSDSQPLAHIDMGDYQISARDGGRVATVFDFHPAPLGLNARTNLYYLETKDFGKTWTTVTGVPVALPLKDPRNPALVRDYKSEQLLVYLKDLQFDAGQPVLLYLTSKGYESGPKNDPRTWWTSRWTGQEWEFRKLTTSDHNYDHGSLYIEEGLWRVIGAMEGGPQGHATGGEVALWESTDQGATWKKSRALTQGSAMNHTYPRRPLNAHPDFYALWADGDAFKPSESSLYFTNRACDRVWRLPASMSADHAKPELVK